MIMIIMIIIMIITINNHQDPHLERLCESFTVLPNLIPLTADRAVFRWWTAADYNEKDDDGHVRGGQ